MMEDPHIAVVILNYNSENDLKICIGQITKQKNVYLSIIIVDNASQTESVKRIKLWLSTWQTDAIYGNQTMVEGFIFKKPEIKKKSGQAYFIENDENKGYSAGNNLGIHVADILNADAVLIANPDMRIEDTSYLAELSKQLFSDTKNFIAASRVLGLDGKDQNPLREATFWEEVLWPRQLLRKFFKDKSYVIPCDTKKPVTVPKVSGCCLMIKMSFLRTINFLDQNVFLYCEEPILSAQVKLEGGNIIYVPSVSAIHAHKKSEKGNSSKRMLWFIKSRNYYLKEYSGYQNWQLIILSLSYSLLSLYHNLKLKIRK